MMPPAMESPEMEVSAVVSRRLRPTSPLPFVAWGILLVLQAVSPDKAWSWLLVGLGFLILIAYLWARMLRGQVSAERRTLGAWVVAGDHLQEQFTLTNRGQLPVLWARIRDQSEVPGYRVDRVETVGAEGERTWTTTGVCQRRGVFQLGPWAVEMADPLGFFTVTHHHPESATIMVYPRASRLPDLDLPSGRAPGRASSSQRAIEETILVGGLRAYSPGDPLRRIHWKATARHDVLMVHDFDREPSGDVWLIVDMDSRVQAGREAEATQEYSVILAASLAARFLRQGERRAVGLLISGRRPVMLPPGRGQPQLWRILEALARAEPAPDLELEGLLRQARLGLGSGRMLVIITPSQNGGWVAPLLPLIARGNAPAAVLLDATTFDPPAGSHQALLGLRSLLAQQRIRSSVLEQGFPFHPIDKIRRRRTEARVLSGFGRVIQVEVEEEV
jgi:uncharacterized protein (DUF58 family)